MLRSQVLIEVIHYMTCFYPRQALRLDSLTAKGKNVVCFLPKAVNLSISNYPNLLTGLPCGQCVGCRLERSRQWAIRCVHEAQLHNDNCFITLTFDQESLDKRDISMSLDRKDLQRFFKRFRKYIHDDYFRTHKLARFLKKSRFTRKFIDRYVQSKIQKIRYYACGEYGEQSKRPHYHSIIFGYDFPDKVLEHIKDGKRYYSSKILSRLWPFGNNIITDVSFDTCAYVARYIMKKHLGKDAYLQYFDYFDQDTGEFVGHRIPEYTTMSRRSGIGKAWLDKYLQDVYPKDKVFMKGRGYSKPPKYYDTQYEIINPSDFLRLKQARVEASLVQSSDNTSDRLAVKQVVKLAQIQSLKRSLE